MGLARVCQRWSSTGRAPRTPQYVVCRCSSRHLLVYQCSPPRHPPHSFKLVLAASSTTWCVCYRCSSTPYLRAHATRKAAPPPRSPPPRSPQVRRAGLRGRREVGRPRDRSRQALLKGGRNMVRPPSNCMNHLSSHASRVTPSSLETTTAGALPGSPPKLGPCTCFRRWADTIKKNAKL